MAKLQEVQSKEPHKVQWLVVPTADITKVARLLQEGQLIPVDKATVQSWEPSQSQRETVVPETTTPPPTRQSGWQGFSNLLGCLSPA